MNMKKLNIWHLMMLTILTLLTMIACGSEDDIDSDTSSLTSSNLTEDGYFDGILYYQITSNSPNEVAVNKVSKTAARVEIPAQINIEGKNYKCTSIGKKAFDGCRGQLSIKIGRYVESISANAFMSCSALEEISVDKSNAIYDSRENCNAIVDSQHNSIILGCKSTTFPSNVLYIGDYAFYGRKNFVSLVLPHNIYYIGYMAFSNCENLTSVSVVADCIGEYAFYNCSKLESVDLGIYLKLIGCQAFNECSNLKSVHCLKKRSAPHMGCQISFNEGKETQPPYPYSLLSHSDDNISYYIIYGYQSGMDVFDSSTYMHGTLYVLEGMTDEYRKTNDWWRFEKIVEEN